jgi:hypothetical protein
MPTFKDDKDQEWTVAITVAALKRVRSKHNIDLTKIGQGTTPLGEELGNDQLLLTDVIFTLLEPAAQTLGVSGEAFSERLSGTSLAAAMAAFWEALTDFFQRLEAGLPKPPTKSPSSPGSSSTASPESSESTLLTSP